MRRATRNGVIAVAAASGAMALSGSAFADSAADGAAVGSPGAISGNSIQLPVHVPVNLCGNTVSVVGLLNPAVGNTCANEGGGKKQVPGSGGAAADGVQKGSPGVVSGNGVQLPVDLPVNVSGNTANVVGIGNPAFGNESVNTSEPQPQPPTTPRTPPAPHTPPKAHPAPPAAPGPASSVSSLASTGADAMLPVAVGSAAFVLGGAVLYRRYRPQPTR